MRIDRFPIMLSHARIKINLIELQKALSLPHISDSPEEQYDREGKISLEEVLCGADIRRERRDDG